LIISSDISIFRHLYPRLMNTTALPDNIPLEFNIPWDQGRHNSSTWVIIVIVSFFAGILNLTTLFVLNSSERNKIVESKEASAIISTLSGTDMTFMFWTCGLYFACFIKQEFVGGYVLCHLAAGIEVFCLAFSVSIIAVMSVHLKLRVTSTLKKNLPLIPIFGDLAFMTIMGIILIVVPPTGDTVLFSSGLICLPKANTISFKIVFVYFVFLLSYMVWNYVQTFSDFM